MSTATRSQSGILHAPFAKGDRVRLAAGTVVHSYSPSQPWRVVTRPYTVTVHHTSIGTVSRERHDAGRVYLPEIVWAGSGGYWSMAQVTPQLCAAHGLDAPELPGQDGFIRSTPLLVIPSYDPGYTNLWTCPNTNTR